MKLGFYTPTKSVRINSTHNNDPCTSRNNYFFRETAESMRKILVQQSLSSRRQYLHNPIKTIFSKETAYFE